MPEEHLDVDTVLVTNKYLRDAKKLHLPDPEDPSNPKCGTETAGEWQPKDPGEYPNSELCNWCEDGRGQSTSANFDYYNALKAAAKDD